MRRVARRPSSLAIGTFLAACSLVGCTSDQPDRLVLFAAEPAGANCANGGSRLDTGVDADGDGTLDASEVTSTSYVCNLGETLVRVGDEPFGNNCVRGGLRIETGVDEDADGTLDDSEVDQTEYQCQLYVVQASPGHFHTCWLLSDGMVRCAGTSSYGQLGRGITTGSSVPVLVPNLMGVTQIDAGGDHTCALLEDQTVRCWGRNNSGQLGTGLIGTTYEVADPVDGLTGVVQVAAGNSGEEGGFSCALLAGGTVKCWGEGNLGQLGDGLGSDSTTPVEVAGVTDAVQIALGFNHACALIGGASPKVVCWGAGLAGQLGNSADENQPTPVEVTGLTTATQIAAGNYHTCAMLSDGGAVCWGSDFYVQLGDDDGVVGSKNEPAAVVFDGAGWLDDAFQIAAGGVHTCALDTVGRVMCWGNDLSGQIGDGSADSTDQVKPYTIPSFAGAIDLELSNGASCVVTDDGRSLCWGHNTLGQCGVGHTSEQAVAGYVDFGAGAVL